MRLTDSSVGKAGAHRSVYLTRVAGGVLIILGLLASLVTPAVTAGAAGTFVDDDGSSHEADIDWLAATGITKGCNPPTNDRYCPDDPVTRAQMAAFLHRALDDLITPGDAVEFIDDQGTFEADIQWLAATGITKGCNPPTNNRYCPDDPVTREQMASFLRRALDPGSSTSTSTTSAGSSTTDSEISTSTTGGATTTTTSTPGPTLPPLDFSQAVWEEVDDGSGPNPRHEAGQVLDGNTLFLIGGRRTQPVEEFALGGSSWSDTGPSYLHFPHHFQPVRVGGDIYLMGGMEGGCCLAENETPFTHVQEFNPDSGTITNGHAIPSARQRGSAGAVAHNGLIYVAGGITGGHGDQTGEDVTENVLLFDVYDPDTGSFTPLDDIPRKRDHFQAAIVGDRIYLIGGRTTELLPSPSLLEANQVGPVDVYDISDGQWLDNHEMDPIPTRRSGAMTAVVGRYIFVIGGEGGTGHSTPGGAAHSVVEVLDTVTGNWDTSLPALSPPRHGTGATVCGFDIYIASGTKTVGGNLDDESDDFQHLDLIGDGQDCRP
jgi:hypothetical protein